MLDTSKDTIKNKYPYIFLVCKGLSIDKVGASSDTVFQETRPGACFKAGDFVKEKLGGDSGAEGHVATSMPDPSGKAASPTHGIANP